MESDRRKGALYRVPENLSPQNGFNGCLCRLRRGWKIRIGNCYYWPHARRALSDALCSREDTFGTNTRVFVTTLCYLKNSAGT